jgi:predicted transposase YbfD/YdcC
MKRKISILALFLAAAMAAATLTGCSSGSASDNAPYYETAAATMAAMPEYGYDGAYMSENVMMSEPAAGNYKNNTADTVTPVADEIERKLIKNAEMTVNTLNADKSYAALSAKISELGGYVFSQNANQSDFYHSINVTFKLPPENLQAFCDFAAESEIVTESSITADDITTQYYDSKIRLDTLRRSLDKYYEYLANADSADEMLMIQSQIDSITMQIESYEGQIRVWDALTTESEVRVYINQTPDPTRAELEDIRWDELSWSNVGTLMSNGIRKVLYGIVAVFQWLLIAIVTLLPIIIIVGIIIIVIAASRRKKRAQKKAIAEEKAAKEAEMKAEAYLKAVDMGYAEPPENKTEEPKE